MNDILQKILSKRGEGEYDVVVMYSGGKDSSYLLYLLKEVYHLRVLAVMVDNGFEHDYTWEPMQNFVNQLGVSLEVLHPDPEMFKTLFKTLITEHEVFQKPGVNHICFICNNILWCSVVRYAKELGIPYVVSGLSLAQLSSGRNKPLVPNELANAIAERSTRMIYKNAVECMKQTKTYPENKEFQEFIGGFADAINGVTTIYPYIYHSVSVSEQKECLKKLNWQPPSLNDMDHYISSGCKIMSGLVYELEKMEMLTLNEREQAKSMVENGLMKENQLSFAKKDVSKETVCLNTKVIKELQVADYLEKICIERGKEYIR